MRLLVLRRHNARSSSSLKDVSEEQTVGDQMIVRGDTYRFRDSGRDSGSNAAVLDVMEALRANFPRLNFSTPNVND